jgi:hypothetical protein
MEGLRVDETVRGPLAERRALAESEGERDALRLLLPLLDAQPLALREGADAEGEALGCSDGEGAGERLSRGLREGDSVGAPVREALPQPDAVDDVEVLPLPLCEPLPPQLFDAKPLALREGAPDAVEEALGSREGEGPLERLAERHGAGDNVKSPVREVLPQPDAVENADAQALPLSVPLALPLPLRVPLLQPLPLCVERALPLREREVAPDALAREGEGAPLLLPLKLRAAEGESTGEAVEEEVPSPPLDALAAGVTVRVRVASGDTDALCDGEGECDGERERSGDVEAVALCVLDGELASEPLPPSELLTLPLEERLSKTLCDARALPEPLCDAVLAAEALEDGHLLGEGEPAAEGVKVSGAARPGSVQLMVLGQQGVGSVVPSVGQKKPAGHNSHAEAPVTLLKEPAGHAICAADPSGQ